MNQLSRKAAPETKRMLCECQRYSNGETRHDSSPANSHGALSIRQPFIGQFGRAKWWFDAETELYYDILTHCERLLYATKLSKRMTLRYPQTLSNREKIKPLNPTSYFFHKFSFLSRNTHRQRNSRCFFSAHVV